MVFNQRTSTGVWSGSILSPSTMKRRNCLSIATCRAYALNALSNLVVGLSLKTTTSPFTFSKFNEMFCGASGAGVEVPSAPAAPSSAMAGLSERER